MSPPFPPSSSFPSSLQPSHSHQAFWLASLAATFALRWPSDPARLLDREAAGSAAAASAVVSLLFALESAFLWECPRKRRLRRALAKSFVALESSSSSRRVSCNGGRISTAGAAEAEEDERSCNSKSNSSDSGGGEKKQLSSPHPHPPPPPPHLRLRGGGPLVAAAVAALGSAWGFAAATFLLFAAASPSGFSESEASGSGSRLSSFLSALPLPRGLPARGISLLAAAGCFAAAVTTTHGVGGRATAGGGGGGGAGAGAGGASRPRTSSSSSSSSSLLRHRFRFWQPFRGGGAFIATQAIGWSLTGLGTLGFLKVSAAVLASAAKTSASAAAAAGAAVASSTSTSSHHHHPPSLLFDVLLTAALMPVAQAVLALSVSLWDASEGGGGGGRAPRRRRGRGRTTTSGGGGSDDDDDDSEDCEDERERQKLLLLSKAAARSRSHPNSLPPLHTWPIIALIYAPAHITISVMVAVLAASPLFGSLILVVTLSVYYGVTERGDPARTGRRHWPAVAEALARVAEPALAAWHGGLEVVHDDLNDDDEWREVCARAEEDVEILSSNSSSSSSRSTSSPSSPSGSTSARSLVRDPLSTGETAILGVAPHGLFPASLLYLGRLRAFAAGGSCWPRGRPPPTPAVASAVMRVPVLRDLASFMGARAVTRSAIADALKVEVKAEEKKKNNGNSDSRRKRSSSSSTLTSTSPAAPSVALVPGGQSELIHTWKLHARKELVLVRRHAGFVRVAQAQGAALVPVLVLGESASLADAISLPELKARSIKALGFPVPFLVSGRFFPGSPLPRGGTPLRFVVGPAIRVAKVGGEKGEEAKAKGHGGGSGSEDRDDESFDFDKREEAVAEAHERYFRAVERLFARHATAAGHGDVRLVWADQGPERKMRKGRKKEGKQQEVGEEKTSSFVADASVTVSVLVAGGKGKRE